MKSPRRHDQCLVSPDVPASTDEPHRIVKSDPGESLPVTH